ncbi:hypothetical protein KO495_00780 [Colwellia sp. D2M02]|uniref:hypothetical protein n=1 Tax=Colwellia sp. D2M02 TaxID=2841562 RepID=UPI001C095064|nr:hypothetical protein [Colwellia sp. D2M02]MBU2891852.1 hypothetical protein [Colwellia sp. D2M02]
MTTLKKIEKTAKSNLIPHLESDFGFEHFSSMIFSRLRSEDIYDFVIFDVTRGGNLRVIVTCSVVELEPDMLENFPRGGGIMIGGYLTDEGVDFTGDYWSLENIETDLNEIVQLLEKYAIPWFDSIKTRQNYLDNMYDYVKEQCSAEEIYALLNPIRSYGFPPKRELV